MNPLILLQLDGMSILEQLQLEEALLRTHEGNFCILNTNASPSIVMGLSAKPEELVNISSAQKDGIPLIKRFSGGGTVYIDENTLFVTFICHANMLNDVPTPQGIMKWTEQLYAPLFPSQFSLRENDYVLGEKKFGGNAQYIRKGRWLHHTSFLWDYSPEKMNYLHMPSKRPQYRGMRPHHEFLCRLKELFPQKQLLLEDLKKHLHQTFEVKEILVEEIREVLELPHRKSTHVL